jgi:hypothetical protein
MATNIGHGNERESRPARPPHRAATHPPAGFGSIHEDLLSASPDSDAATAALVNEIKARAKTEFAARNMPAAEALYKKGTEVLATDATLFGNLAAVRIVMGKYSDAVADADGALKADPAWAKGFFRKAQALEKLKVRAIRPRPCSARPFSRARPFVCSASSSRSGGTTPARRSPAGCRWSPSPRCS